MTPGFWLIVAIFALGLSWLIVTLSGWLVERLARVYADRDAEFEQETADWEGR